VKFNINAIFIKINDVLPTTIMTRHASPKLPASVFALLEKTQTNNLSNCQNSGYQVTENQIANVYRRTKRR
jgi:hypothetical protein